MNTLQRTALAAAAIAMVLSSNVAAETNNPPTIVNGITWLDTAGNPIAAHDGGVSRFGDKFYWYGSSYAGNPKGNYGIQFGEIWNGVQCYSSDDLVHWKYEGVVLPRPKQGWCRLGTSICPRVLYHAKYKTYVLWHCWFITPQASFAMVSVADKPTGPFRLLGPRETGAPGGFAYSIGLFQDDDGTAYIVYCDGLEYFTRIDRLTDDYQSSLKNGIVIMLPQHEAPTLIKYKGKYIVAGSGVDGWNPTETTCSIASSPFGPYSPKRIMSEQKTWKAQIFSFLHIKESDTLIALCDQWWIPDKTDLNKSRYLWIPVDFDPATGAARMIYRDQWSPWKGERP